MIILGQEVKDVITGLKGTAVARNCWLNGCVRIGIQAKVNKDGKVPDVEWADEKQVSVLNKGKIKQTRHNPAGPTPSPRRFSDPKE